jgi:hypothetical protein
MIKIDKFSYQYPADLADLEHLHQCNDLLREIHNRVIDHLPKKAAANLVARGERFLLNQHLDNTVMVVLGYGDPLFFEGKRTAVIDNIVSMKISQIDEATSEKLLVDRDKRVVELRKAFEDRKKAALLLDV